MLRLSVAIALSLISITACGREPSTTATPPATAPVAQESAPVAETPAAADPAQTAESAQATASQESADAEGTATDSRDVALERIAAMPADQQLPGGKWQVGKNYTPLVPSQPTNVAPGKVEVVEVFWYACPHCAALEPFIQSWMKNKPENIQIRSRPGDVGTGASCARAAVLHPARRESCRPRQQGVRHDSQGRRTCSCRTTSRPLARCSRTS